MTDVCIEYNKYKLISLEIFYFINAEKGLGVSYLPIVEYRAWVRIPLETYFFHFEHFAPIPFRKTQRSNCKWNQSWPFTCSYSYKALYTYTRSIALWLYATEKKGYAVVWYRRHNNTFLQNCLSGYTFMFSIYEIILTSSFVFVKELISLD